MGRNDISDKQKIFRDSIGQKATVEREQIGELDSSPMNRKLCDLGLEAQKVRNDLQHYQYMGSAAVHVYVNPVLGHLALVSQANPLVLYRCSEEVAAKAIEDLAREMKAAYNKRTGKLRSGF